MKARAQQLLLGLALASPHRLDRIPVEHLVLYDFFPFHLLDYLCVYPSGSRYTSEQKSCQNRQHSAKIHSYIPQKTMLLVVSNRTTRSIVLASISITAGLAQDATPDWNQCRGWMTKVKSRSA